VGVAYLASGASTRRFWKLIQSSMPMFNRVSVKRRRALLESNPLSNSRKARLHTAADGGEAKTSPPNPIAVVALLHCKNDLRCRWKGHYGLKNSRRVRNEVTDPRRPEAEGFRLGLRVSAAASCRLCLIACNLRQFDELGRLILIFQSLLSVPNFNKGSEI
jgi:hypothetical protein